MNHSSFGCFSSWLVLFVSLSLLLTYSTPLPRVVEQGPKRERFILREATFNVGLVGGRAAELDAVAEPLGGGFFRRKGMLESKEKKFGNSKEKPCCYSNDS